MSMSAKRRFVLERQGTRRENTVTRKSILANAEVLTAQGDMALNREAEPEEDLPSNMEVRRVPGDGLCLFHALCCAVPSLGGAAKLREAMITYMSDEAHTEGRVWMEESQALREDPKLYGGHTTIVAFSKRSGRPSGDP